MREVDLLHAILMTVPQVLLDTQVGGLLMIVQLKMMEMDHTVVLLEKAILIMAPLVARAHVVMVVYLIMVIHLMMVVIEALLIEVDVNSQPQMGPHRPEGL